MSDHMDDEEVNRHINTVHGAVGTLLRDLNKRDGTHYALGAQHNCNIVNDHVRIVLQGASIVHSYRRLIGSIRRLFKSADIEESTNSKYESEKFIVIEVEEALEYSNGGRLSRHSGEGGYANEDARQQAQHSCVYYLLYYMFCCCCFFRPTSSSIDDNDNDPSLGRRQSPPSSDRSPPIRSASRSPLRAKSSTSYCTPCGTLLCFSLLVALLAIAAVAIVANGGPQVHSGAAAAAAAAAAASGRSGSTRRAKDGGETDLYNFYYTGDDQAAATVGRESPGFMRSVLFDVTTFVYHKFYARDYSGADMGGSTANDAQQYADDTAKPHSATSLRRSTGAHNTPASRRAPPVSAAKPAKQDNVVNLDDLYNDVAN